jgi:hypothetical protein
VEAKSTKRRTWLDKMPPALRARVEAEVDCRALSLSVLYRLYNLVRFCQPRTFRAYAGERRRRLVEYDARRLTAVRQGRPMTVEGTL